MSRRQARSSLLGFTQYTNPDYRAARHHQQIAEALEAAERGDIDRVAIFVPARHGKSELASRRFPAWFIGRNPQKQIICASYNSSLASDFGREVRNVVASEEFAKVFPAVSLSQDSQAADRWHTNLGGVYVATGVGGTLTGRGAHLAVIDDPHKDRKEADSEVGRDNVWSWYRSTLYTRLMPRAALVLVMTRWHEDDLAGRILNSKEGEKWHVVELPALKDGQALWPEWYPVEALERIRDSIGAREFSALYQQSPAPDEGTYFRREWFKWYDPRTPPPEVNRYISSDFAVTEGGGDFTEIATHGIDTEGNLYAGLSWWYGQTAADTWIEKICDQVAQHLPFAFFGESGQIRRAIEPALYRRMVERNTHCRLEWITRTHDKPTMARALQARASMGRVYLPDNEAGHRWLAQALAFPAGKVDDSVDMLALMAAAMDQAHPALVVPQEIEPSFPTDFG